MSTSLSAASDASAVTLMSTDVERIVLGMAKIHDAWSTLVQVACAMYILYRQVGAVFIAPVVLSLGKITTTYLHYEIGRLTYDSLYLHLPGSV